MSHSDQERVQQPLSQERTQRIVSLSKFLINSLRHELITPSLASNTVSLSIALPKSEKGISLTDALELKMPIKVHTGEARLDHTRHCRLLPNSQTNAKAQNVHDNGNWEIIIDNEYGAMLEYDVNTRFGDASASAMQYLADAQKSVEEIVKN